MKVDAIAYDIEIARAIPEYGKERIEGVEYCKGWGDKKGMGISVVATYDLANGLTQVFFEDNLGELEEYMRDRVVIGFNSLTFDDLVLQAHGVNVTTDYDLKQEIQFAATGKKGLRVKGYRLEDIARANLSTGKRDVRHELIPVWWQQGKRGMVTNDCIEDVWLLARLVQKLPTLIDPVSMREVTLPEVPVKQPVLL